MIIFQKRVAGLSEGALNRFVLRARKASGLKGLVNVLVTSSREVRSMNRQFLKKNRATDVLSFPAAVGKAGAKKRKSVLAGEIAISAEIAAQNATRLGHLVRQEIKILTLHGILHLAGHDHERDDGQMARQEFRLRSKLRLPAGLIERTRDSNDNASLVKPANNGRQNITSKKKSGRNRRKA